MAGLSRRAFVSALLAMPVAARAQGPDPAPVQARYAGRGDFIRALGLGTPFPAGAVVEAGGMQYVRDGGGAIPDLPGWAGLGQDGFQSFEHFGAVGDGIADDMVPIRTALAAGVPLEGHARTYGVAGAVSLRSGTHLRNMTFRQLRPGTFKCITLSGVGVDRLVLRQVAVDRNGDGRSGGRTDDGRPNWAINQDFGIFIQGGIWHHFENLEAFGDNSGTGILFRGLDGRSLVLDPYVHDMHCERAEILDDVMQGLWFDRCRDLAVSCRVHDLTTRSGAGPVTTDANRGVTVTGCSDVTIRDSEIRNVGQAIDVTGSDGNIRCRAINNRIVQPYSVGVKFANSAVECQALRNWVYRPGRNAIIVSGPSESNLPRMTENCLVEGNIGIDVGFGGHFETRAHGVIVERQADHQNYPRGTIVRNNVMHDTQEVPTMLYGAFCDAEPRPGNLPNLACGNISVGHIKAAEQGFAGRCSL